MVVVVVMVVIVVVFRGRRRGTVSFVMCLSMHLKGIERSLSRRGLIYKYEIRTEWMRLMPYDLI